MLGGAARALAPALTVGAVVAAGRAAWQLGELGAKAEQAETSLANLSGGAQQAEQYISAVQKATKGTISKMDIMQASISAQTLGVVENADQMARMAEIAVTLGKSQGMTATQSIDDMTTALGRQSSKILDNLGITMQASEAYQKYAKRIGTTADALSEQEKRQAFVTEALAKGAEVAEDLGGIIEDNQTQVEQGRAAWKDLRVEIGKNFSDAVGDASAATADFARTWANALKLTREMPVRIGELNGDLQRQIKIHGYTADVLERINRLTDDYNFMLRGAQGELWDWQNREEQATRAIEEHSGALNDADPIYKSHREILQTQTNRLQGMADAAGEAAYSYKSIEKNTKSATPVTDAYNEKVRELIATNREAAAAAAEHAGATATLAENLFEATRAEIASEMIGMLDPEEMGAEAFMTATTEIGTAFGIMDEKSIALADNLPKVAEALEKGVIPAEDADEALGYLVDTAGDGAVNFDDLLEKFGETNETLPRMREPLDNAGRSLNTFRRDSVEPGANALNDLAEGASNAKRELDKLPSEVNIAVNITSSGSIPNADRRQHGGPVERDRPYVVGETGPELFVPDTGGDIMPMAPGGGGSAGSGGVNVNVNLNGEMMFMNDDYQLARLADRIAQQVYMSGGHASVYRGV